MSAWGETIYPRTHLKVDPTIAADKIFELVFSDDFLEMSVILMQTYSGQSRGVLR